MTEATQRDEDSAVLRKARGAFFTPPEIADYLVNWAVRTGSDRVLEPSCGEAAFLVPAVRRLATLGATGVIGQGAPLVDGVEIHAESAARARSAVRAAGGRSAIEVRDFFDSPPSGDYDAVVGNPPFVRFQSFSGASRARSLEAALRGGVALSGLASSWAAFLIHSALHLRQGGRLALVLPAELLSVNYAGVLRKYLFDNFGRVDLVLFEERVFGPVQEEVLLLLAEDFGAPTGTDHANVFQAGTLRDLRNVPSSRRWEPAEPAGKWTESLIPARATEVVAKLQAVDDMATVADWGKVTLGAVTGNNGFFALSPSEVARLRLLPSDVLPISPPGSAHLRGLAFGRTAWSELGDAGARTYLFRPINDPSRGAAAYIEEGEAQGVDRAYKCRVRAPWWRVPIVTPPALLLTYMNADAPRVCANPAGFHHLNSVHGVYPRPSLKRLAMAVLPLIARSTFTVLSAETVGRAYGGGMLKVEPSEALRLLVPSPALAERLSPELVSIKPRLARLMRGGNTLAAEQVIDEVVLGTGFGLTGPEIAQLQYARAELLRRRRARK